VKLLLDENVSRRLVPTLNEKYATDLAICGNAGSL
jgi:hypothetical protein